jgi:hypothetical protein
MRIGTKWRTWWAWAIACVAILLAGCSRPPAEEQLRAALDAMQAAATERRPRDFMQFVADDFVGNDGVDGAALHNLLRAQLLRNKDIGATRGPLDIQVQGERATVKFSVVVTGGAGGLIPERAQSYSITSGWRLENGEWRIYLAEWTPAL